MWEGWKQYGDKDSSTCYELMVGSTIKVLVVTCLTKKTGSEPMTWKVQITAFNPLGGEYIDFEGVFPSFAEAEKVAWEQAQESIKLRKS